MGDSVKPVVRGLTAFSTFGASEVLRTGGSSKARSAKAAQARAQRLQEETISRQQQREESRLAESDDEIARRKALTTGKRAGRSLLISSNQTGVSGSNLGGG